MQKSMPGEWIPFMHKPTRCWEGWVELTKMQVTIKEIFPMNLAACVGSPRLLSQTQSLEQGDQEGEGNEGTQPAARAKKKVIDQLN